MQPIHKTDCHSGENTRLRISRSFKAQCALPLCYLLIALFTHSTLSAQTGCITGCTSNDVQIQRAYLMADLNGTPLDPNCTYGSQVSAYLYLDLVTNTPRVGVSISGKIVNSGNNALVGSPAECFSDSLRSVSGHPITTVKFKSPVNWTCGTQVKLTDVLIGWGTGNTNFCTSSAAQCPSTKSKCWKQGPQDYIPIVTFPCTPATGTDPANRTRCQGDSVKLNSNFTAATNTQVTGVKWQYSTDGNTWNDVSGANYSVSTATLPAASGSTTLTIISVTGLDTYQFRAYFTSTSSSNLVCTGTSAAATLRVDPTSDGGSAAATTSPVCSGSGTTVSLSGNTGSIQNWQYNTDGSTWITINSTNTSISTGNLTTTTQYRAVVKSGVCSAANSSGATVTVNPTTVPGTLSAAQTICSGSQPNDLSLSGNTGNVVKWQKSTSSDFLTGVTDISNTSTTLTSASIGALTQDTWFRVVVKSGVCPEGNSNSIKISVDPSSNGGSVSAAQTICSGNLLNSDLSVSGITGSVVKWQKSTDNFVSNSTDISNTTTTLTKAAIGALTQDTWFRAVVQSGVCNAANSSVVKITVDAAPTTATAGSTQNLCGTLTSTGLGGNTPSVGSGVWSLKTGPGTVSFNSSASMANATATVSTVGTYVFTWTISNGTCTASTADITVNYYSKPGQPTADVTQPTCGVPTGTITVTSGTTGLTFSINSTNPADFTNTNGVFSGLAAGDYTIRAKNANGCISNGVTKTINTAPSTTPAADIVYVTYPNCSSTTGTIKVVMAGGTAYDNTVYEFSNDGTNFGSNPVFSFTAGQGYSITVRRINDTTCTATASCQGETQGTINSRLTTSTQSVTGAADETDKLLEAQTRVIAYPNPYNDKVRFQVTSLESGKGSLEVYNMLGQKVKTVYQGQILAGSQSFEMNVPVKQRSSLIYVLRIGNRQMSGKLLQLNR